MLINQGIAVSTSSVLLVPYAASHVPKYHEWMKDPEIQTLTASEPLSLAEEYAMQKSWREDGDKLTFIICRPLPLSFALRPITSGPGPENVQARTEEMIGDVNLFLSPPDDGDDEEGGKGICTGEVELMIAEPGCRRKGYGRGAVLSFLMFVEGRLEGILEEFLGAEKGKGLRLRVKIGGENEKSIGLFESVGFRRTGEGVNYFGEVELRFERVLRVGGGEGGMMELGERFGVGGYREVGYEEEGDVKSGEGL